MIEGEGLATSTARGDGAPLLDGAGVLEVARSGATSVVLRAVAKSPLRLMTPRNHGHAVWAFQSSLGGGLVDGDAIALDVRVGAGAAALVTTQASTKVYRAHAAGGAGQRLTADVGHGGLLVILPDAVACFAGARLAASVDVRLGEGASLVLVDAMTCGRAARGERWEFDSVRSAITVSRGDRPLLFDVIELDPRHGPLAPRMGRFDALATIVAIGPGAPTLIVPPPVRGAPLVAAASPLIEGLLVRMAATSAELLHGGVREILGGLAGVLGDDPFARKW